MKKIGVVLYLYIAWYAYKQEVQTHSVDVC